MWQKGQVQILAAKSTEQYGLSTEPQVLQDTGSYSTTCAVREEGGVE